MTRTTTYVAAEPEMVERFEDCKGGLHMTREEAIEATFRHDLTMACADVIENHDHDRRYQSLPILVMGDFVRAVIENNPDMARVILGDRDAT